MILVNVIIIVVVVVRLSDSFFLSCFVPPKESLSGSFFSMDVSLERLV